jgi:hypothetical protein
MTSTDDLLEVLRWAWPETEWYSGRAGAAVHARTPGIQYLKPSSLDDLARIERRVIEMGRGEALTAALFECSCGGFPIKTNTGHVLATMKSFEVLAFAPAATRLRALVAVARANKQQET